MSLAGTGCRCGVDERDGSGAKAELPVVDGGSASRHLKLCPEQDVVAWVAQPPVRCAGRFSSRITGEHLEAAPAPSFRHGRRWPLWFSRDHRRHRLSPWLAIVERPLSRGSISKGPCGSSSGMAPLSRSGRCSRCLADDRSADRTPSYARLEQNEQSISRKIELYCCHVRSVAWTANDVRPGCSRSQEET
jgi:hypothetical protein